jgi:hypothetical protein
VSVADPLRAWFFIALLRGRASTSPDIKDVGLTNPNFNGRSRAVAQKVRPN